MGKALSVLPKPARGNQARRPAGIGTNDFQTIPFIDKPRRHIMAFVNERVSEDDIRKYGLDELMR
ncbi:MAG: hypothetical protein LBQ62_00930, partial [Candidatus Accumulibacter sp.]|nr:hypothetical protein [Accumulibacter sp.]